MAGFNRFVFNMISRHLISNLNDMLYGTCVIPDDPICVTTSGTRSGDRFTVDRLDNCTMLFKEVNIDNYCACYVVIYMSKSTQKCGQAITLRGNIYRYFSCMGAVKRIGYLMPILITRYNEDYGPIFRGINTIMTVVNYYDNGFITTDSNPANEILFRIEVNRLVNSIGTVLDFRG